MHIHNLFLMEDFFFKNHRQFVVFCFTTWAGFFSNVIFFLLHKRNETINFSKGVVNIEYHKSIFISDDHQCFLKTKGPTAVEVTRAFHQPRPRNDSQKNPFCFFQKPSKKKIIHVIPNLEFHIELTKFFSGRGFLMFFQQTPRCRALECLVNV